MKQFNYERAWDELALPAYEALPEKALSMINWIGQQYAEISQASDLGMDELPGIREMLNAYSLEELSSWSQTVYYFGHWGYKDEGLNIQINGTYWKVSKLLDQEIARRVFEGEIARNRIKVRNGLYLWIDNGALNLAYEVKWAFGNVFRIGAPTKELINEVCEVLTDKPEKKIRRLEDEWIDSVCKVVTEIKNKHCGEVWDTSSYMEDC